MLRTPILGDIQVLIGEKGLAKLSWNLLVLVMCFQSRLRGTLALRNNAEENTRKRMSNQRELYNTWLV